MHPADATGVALAARIVREGGVVVFPTRGLYGLGADARNRAAVERVFSVKRRPDRHPVLILIEKSADLAPLVTEVSLAARQLMARFWPGRLTLVFRASPEISSLLTSGTGKIGIRVAGHPVAAALLKAAGGPLTGTSANRSGDAACARAADLDPRVAGDVDLVLDAGTLAGGAGSTVVDVTAGAPSILREGAVATNDILSAATRGLKNRD